MGRQEVELAASLGLDVPAKTGRFDHPPLRVFETLDPDVIVIDVNWTSGAGPSGPDEASASTRSLQVVEARGSEIAAITSYLDSVSVPVEHLSELEASEAVGHGSATVVYTDWPTSPPGPDATPRDVWAYGIHLHTTTELVRGWASLFADDGAIDFALIPSGFPSPGFPRRIVGRSSIDHHLTPLLTSSHDKVTFLGLRTLTERTMADPEWFLAEFEGVYRVEASGETVIQPHTQLLRARSGKFVEFLDYFNARQGLLERRYFNRRTDR